MARITAVFDSQSSAEAAVIELRRMGVTDAHLSFVGGHNGPTGSGPAGGQPGAVDTEGEARAANAGKGLLAGAGVGALFGLAAALIPGVGPFITAGALATSLGAAGGGAAAGALVGGTVGTLTGALVNAGYSREEADYYGGRVQGGGTLVAIEDSHGTSESTIYDVLQRHGGHIYGR